MSTEKKSKDLDRMMIEAVKGGYSFFAWQSLGGVVEKCECKVKAYRKDFNEIELEVCAGQEEKLEKIISGNRILNFYVPEMSVSFSSELKTLTADKKLKLYRPSDYTFYERRKHERIVPAKTCYFIFEHNKQIIKKPVFDLSLGGVAVVLSKTEKLQITKGKEFPLTYLFLDGRKLKLKALCVNTFTIDPHKYENLHYGGYKLAFLFTGMSKEDRAILAEFITQEALTSKASKKPA